ncbi:response regulator transcription factor [Burkholderia sp. Ac-20379]|uniref:response regulator transcription factor n=1 Tax=Burkholderia sp. Ac-20379 TaxID=2703900 RepID=UPI00197F9E45|nr:winged helix-turn-helix domain-containing protein [Burkholderia sp. Ac-20379]MBN3723071.1 response regulator transcription factor [Burkholderia sp. Ac-20379]
MRILIFSGSSETGPELLRDLRAVEHEVEWSCSFSDASYTLLRDFYDVLLIDLDGTGQDGLRLLNERPGDAQHCRVIAFSREETPRIETFPDRKIDIDTVLIKPTDIGQIISLINKYSYQHENRQITRLGDMRIDSLTRTVLIGSHRSTLSPTDMAILTMFINEPNRIFSRAEIAADLDSYGDQFKNNSIDVCLHRLRSKIGRGRILNIWGRGFRLAVYSRNGARTP